MNKNFLIFIFLLSGSFAAFSQQTAGDFFETISDKYSELESYSAVFKFTTGVHSNIVQEGRISYLSPNYLRLDYSSPENQVLCVNSRKLSIYVPAHETLFEQTINSEEDALTLETSGFTSQGLSLFSTNYSISYVNGPELEVLDKDNPEEVYKLRLIPRKYTEPFEKIVMSISSDGFIRRLESTTRTDELIILDIVDIDTTAKIDPAYFDYEAPPTATKLTDFLFSKDQLSDQEE